MGLKNLKVSYKINIISLITIILLGIVTFVLYNGMSKINNSFENSSFMSDLVLTIAKTSEQGLQVSNALRGIIINPDDTKAKENFIQAVKELDDLMLVLKDSTKKSQGFEKFEIAPLYASQIKVLNKIIEKIKNSEALTKEDNTLSTKEWRPLKAALLKWQERNLERNKEIKEELNKTVSSVTTFILIILLITILSILVTIQLITRNIVSSLNIFQNGLLSFFSYLNKESSGIKMLDSSSNDEFGEMSKVINENISKTQKGIEEDRRLIDETIAVLGEFEQGDLCQRLKIDVANPALMQLKKVLNNMGENLEKNINSILDVLEQYANYNYLNKIDKQGLKEHLLKLANGVNHLGDSITSMLVENKSNGMTLDESSTILLTNVDKLNISSNEAAASLEETAAALEEITSNIRNNTENIAKMAKYSNEITKASSEGEKLANSTTTAMDEINTQVNLVNEAIGVIDNIAFQTNILSLNAAVEAATAGEAGKGFAVVAQEVRNLATRSAEAAKEIKAIVERATVKANEGKEIATNMIEGYKNLNNNISSTMNLISDIENASKEQLLGIEQINDAVNQLDQLDQQTQQNAMIASQSHDIALSTDEIAKLIVSDANQKEFEGKNEVKAKEAGMKKEVKEHIIASSPKKIIKASKPNINSTKEITSSSSNDEWESF